MSFFKSILFLGTRISNTTAPRKSFSDSILKNRIFSPGYVPYNYFSSISSSVSCLVPTLLARSPVINQTRSVTKWSLNKGKRKSVKAVTQRFYRLQWGAWIRPMVGNHKRHWSKTAKRKIRGAQHVFCNSTQSSLLDKMVTKFWKKPRYYVDDIYQPYHQREEFLKTAVKPR